MDTTDRYSYRWFIDQFTNTKTTAEDFVLAVNEQLFFQKPSENRWSIAECYGHLIKYGNLYFSNIQSAISATANTNVPGNDTYPPRWLPEKIIHFFEPPYKLKVKTINPMKPDSSSDKNRMELLDEYLNLQNRLIEQLERAHQSNVHMTKAKVTHPVFSIIKMTLSECFLLLEAHQRRHQWQAEQTMEMLKEHHSK